jgi:tRNA-2-methylthio-N6-dimethylallyladenosine synthase
MNVYDSARMADVLKPLGFAQVEDAALADMVILNTCHIREKAAEKVYSDLGRLKQLKVQRERQGRQMILAVAGCVAQAEGEEILSRAPYVDMVFGPQSYHRLPEMVAKADRLGGKVLDTDFPAELKFDFLPDDAAADTAGAGAAFLTVQEGCDKFCTFCVVPYTRGAEYSRPAAAILAEAGRLARGGASEITLLGQNVNNYRGETPGGARWGLGRLIRELAMIDGIRRLRYTTSYPADMDDELITAHRDVEKLMPFLHLPVQSGSDRVLKAMNRRHTADDYRHLAERLRKARPDIGLSSDFIVGFPGEDDADFQATLKLATDVGFVQAYSFKYSPRPGTPAAALEHQIPDQVKSERLTRLQEILNAQQLDFNRASVGRVMPVLLDRPGRATGQLMGRSPYMQSVHVAGMPATALGAIVELHIAAAYANSLAGVPVDGADRRRAAGQGLPFPQEALA